MEAGDLDPHGPQFNTGLLDVLSSPNKSMVGKILLAVIAPWYSMGNAAYKLGGMKNSRWVYWLISAFPFYLWIILMTLEPLVDAISYVAWTVLFIFFAYGTSIRYSIRLKYNIYGNAAEDFFAVMLLYPFAAFQMEHHMEHDYDLGKRNYHPEPPVNHHYAVDGKRHLPENGYGTPTISMHDLSSRGGHLNPGADGDITTSGDSYWKKTEII